MQQCASLSVHTSFSNVTHGLQRNNPVLPRLEHRRNRQCFPNLRWSLYRVCPTLSTETSPDSWLDSRMAKHSRSSRGRIFYRIRVSEHDLGSSLDRKGDTSCSSDRLKHNPISDYSFLHNRMASSTSTPVRPLACFLALWSFMVSS